MAAIVPGQEIGAYRIVEQIGKGGMATVYKAYQASMDRFVAIKVLPFEFAQNKEFIERFRREVLTIAKLEHPQILPVYDSGEFDGTPYLVMRYLDAGTLKERLDRERLSLDRIDHIFTQLARALDYAHNLDIVHRDIKPSNVMLTARDDVLLTDFGIAKLLGAETQFTATGALTGTPAYMSPEQGDGRPVDNRSDLYSLGVVLYELVTGRVPFEAETPLAVILQHLQAPLPPPSSVAEVHPAVEQVILKALAKDPADRFPSAAAFLAAWKAAVAASETAETVSIPAASGLTHAGDRPEPAGDSAETIIERAAAAPTVIETRAAPGTPKTPRRRFGWLWIGGILAVVVAGVCISAGYAIFQACCAPQVDGPGPVLPAEMGSLLTGPALPFPDGGGSWTSWTGGTVIFSVTLHEGDLYAGGPGGISVYDTDGTLIRTITVRDGLPTNRVNDLFSDPETGDLWAATDEGAARFTGGDWVTYGFEDGLGDTNLLFLGRAAAKIVAGSAYAADGGGIYLFDGGRWTAAPGFDSTLDGSVTQFATTVPDAVHDAATGLTWFATWNGLGAWDGETWTRYTTADGLPDNTVNGVGIDGDGRIVVATEGGAAYGDGGAFIAFEPTLGQSIHNFEPAPNGDLWFSAAGGVYRYSPENGNWDFFESGSLFPTYNVFRAAAAGDGRVYFGTEGVGVAVFDGGSFGTLDTPPGPVQPASGGVIPGPGGELWFVEEYGLTIDIHDPLTDSWSPYLLEVCCVVPFVFDEDGNLWGGGDTGLWRIDPQGDATNFTSRQGLPSDQVFHAAVAPDGRIWVGTNAGLAVVEGQSVVAAGVQTGAASDEFYVLMFDSDGGLWAATDQELVHRSADGDWETYSSGNPFEEYFLITSVAEGADGSIWVGTYGYGVYRLHAGAWSLYGPTDPGVSLPSPDINGIAVAPDGSVWFATTAGAARFDGETWSSWSLDDGLNHWNVNDVHVMPDGTVWFATSGGVTRWGP